MMKLLQLVISFLKIGALSFGGGYAMVPFFEKEILIHNWASVDDYKKVIVIAQMLPGPFAVDSSAYIGYRVGGLAGAFIATIALALPSFVSLVLVSRYYPAFKSNQYIDIALKSVRPAVIGLLISAVYIIGLQPLIEEIAPPNIISVLKPASLIIGSFLVLKFTKINPLFLIIASALFGILLL